MESRESKPSWSDVPRELVAQLSDLLGARITDADIVWGGFGPSATFLIRTDDDRKFFCKGSHLGSTEAGKKALLRERVIYESLPQSSKFGPAFHGAIGDGEWQLLVLEFVERVRDVPPWSADAFRSTVRMLARFHGAMPSHARTVLLDAETEPLTADLYAARPGWRHIAKSDQDRNALLALFADPAAAAKWIDRNIGDFIALEQEATRLDGPRSWIHLDVRSDNLIFRRAGEPTLVDWPFLSYGPMLMDVAFFLPSVAGESGPPPHEGLTLYEHESVIRFDEHQVRVTVAVVAGFFAARAGQPPIPGLPRLRWVQALQLCPCLDWISGLMNIEPPPAPLQRGSADMH